MKRTGFNIIPLWLQPAFLILSVLLLLLPALYNGYPLVYPDTGSYINSGFLRIVPVDRPLIYGMFIEHVSMEKSLWIVIVVQALVISFLLVLLAKLLRKDSWLLTASILITAVALFTAASNFICQVMPDIFTSAMILSIFLFLAYCERSKIIAVLLVPLIFFADTAHLSNLLISTACVALLLLAKLFRNKALPRTRYILWLAAILACCWIFIPFFNHYKGVGYTYSRTGNIFLMGRLSETGIISDYLDEHCGKKDIPLCKYRDKFPLSSDLFLWHESPLYDGLSQPANWDSIWLQKNMEYAPIIKDMITSPKYILKIAGQSITGTLKLLTCVGVEKLEPMMKGSPVLPQMEWHYPNETAQYSSSRQAAVVQRFPLQNALQIVGTILSLIGLVVIFSIRKYRNTISKVSRQLLFIIVSGLILNAWICSTLSTTAWRFQSRVAWLLPLVFFVMLLDLLLAKKAGAGSGGPDN